MQIVINIVYYVLTIQILALSIYLLYRVIGFFHIAHANTFTMGAFITYTITIQQGLVSYIAIPVAIIISISTMLLINKFIYRPLQKRKLKSWQMLVASLGVYVVLQNTMSMVWGDSALSFRTWEVKAGHPFIGAYITDVQIITMAVCIALLAFSWLFLEKTNIGQKIQAVSSNPQLSSILGISRNKAVVSTFILSSALAACAGILIAADADMTPTMGFNWLLYAVVAMIIAGMGRTKYLLLGTSLLATAQHLSAYYFDSKWMNATAFIVLIVFLYFKPYGFSSQGLKKADI